MPHNPLSLPAVGLPRHIAGFQSPTLPTHPHRSTFSQLPQSRAHIHARHLSVELLLLSQQCLPVVLLCHF